MGLITLDERGIPRKIEDIDLAEKIVELRKKKDPWEVIDLLVKAWAQRAADEVDALMIQIDEYKEKLVDPKFAQLMESKDQERRFTLSFPKSLMIMIRSVYKADELPMDTKFFATFSRKYPMFKIADQR